MHVHRFSQPTAIIEYWSVLLPFTRSPGAKSKGNQGQGLCGSELHCVLSTCPSSITKSLLNSVLGYFVVVGP